MTTDPRLERYLASLEKALMPFPVSDRADIITEIKSHVLAALDRDPEARLDSILASLGEPETVANRYLLERGMKPAKTAIHPIVKWLVIGSLGAFAMILIFSAFLLVHFGSILKVDGDRVQALGGLIDIAGGNAKVSVNSGEDTVFAGETKIAAGDSVSVKFTNGKFEFKNSDETKLAWACKAEGSTFGGAKTESNSTTLDFTSFKRTKCTIALPKGTLLKVNGENGKANFEAPLFSVDMTMDNGKVHFLPDTKTNYKYDLSIQNGKADDFKSSNEADSRTIKIHLTNGRISKED